MTEDLNPNPTAPPDPPHADPAQPDPPNTPLPPNPPLAASRAYVHAPDDPPSLATPGKSVLAQKPL